MNRSEEALKAMKASGGFDHANNRIYRTKRPVANIFCWDKMADQYQADIDAARKVELDTMISCGLAGGLIGFMLGIIVTAIMVAR